MTDRGNRYRDEERQPVKEVDNPWLYPVELQALRASGEQVDPGKGPDHVEAILDRVDPRKTAAIAGNRNAGAAESEAIPTFAARITPARPAIVDEATSAPKRRRSTRTPESRAAASFPPIAKRRRPVGVHSST